MQWLSLDTIKAHCRIETSDEDTILTLYGESAEAMLLNYIGMTYEEVIAEYTSFPKPLIHASLMLVDVSYQHRSPISQANMYIVPYTFDILVKPYVRLADADEDETDTES